MYQTCVYQNRVCIDTLNGPICDCQPGYAVTSGFNAECSSKLKFINCKAYYKNTRYKIWNL